MSSTGELYSTKFIRLMFYKESQTKWIQHKRINARAYAYLAGEAVLC